MSTQLDAQFIPAIECGEHTIAATVFSRRLVSTVKLIEADAIDIIFRGPYETMRFNRRGKVEQVERYFSRKDAVKGHWAMCLVYLQSQ